MLKKANLQKEDLLKGLKKKTTTASILSPIVNKAPKASIYRKPQLILSIKLDDNKEDKMVFFIYFNVKNNSGKKATYISSRQKANLCINYAYSLINTTFSIQ
ncbi:MAG: hypothetical protein C4617_00035 [Candidatus Liberibacter europaeus]|uniref:Uncharacterized protein n=1 Tax=Candidatus Liberibacter europaeus TaxID=744859 RepID=A0A2T4VWF6_9HYPH|nr:hypothetical protein [Candidatus Liberibacter europaeus]MBY7649922.1 hypothetical protein [Candidatus Liberibacter europaeus]PTL86080.1 MAG: hypothetical protein C4617_05540 [Candidatus Liberibacter europaeus]PTL86861.1 MAG: hypothetical protein C4617_00035 [Candidatus Liberibacter europaeus]